MSASDFLWSTTPWSASAPPGVPPSGSNPEQLDSVTYFQPMLEATRRSLPHVPLWNPSIMGGRPFLANAQSAVFSPFNLPGYVFGFWRSMALIVGLRLFVAALGVYVLARALDLRFGGALLAGLVFGFGLYAVVWAPWSRLGVFALLPWVLAAVDRVVRRPTPLSGVALAGAVGLQFLAGMPQASASVLIGSVAFFGWRVVADPDARIRWRRASLAVALGLGGGTALAALVIVPFAELLFHSYDYYWRSRFLLGHLSPEFLLGVFLPDFWGRAPRTATFLSGTLLTDRAMYGGALTVMLAGAVSVLRPTRDRVAVAASAAVGLALVVGVKPLVTIYSHVPIIAAMKLNYMLVWFILGVALLAGWGLDDVAERGPSLPRPRLALGLAALILILPVTWMALGRTLSLQHVSAAAKIAWGSLTPQHEVGRPPFDPDVVRLSALLEWLVPAALGVALLGARLRSRPLIGNGAFVALAVGLVAVDLWRMGLGVNPVIRRSHAEQPETGAVRYLQSRRPSRFAGLTSGFFAPLYPNLAMRYGLADARGYDFPVDFRYGRFWSTRVRRLYPDTALLIAGRPPPRAIAALGMLGVTDVLTDPGAPAPKGAGLRLAYRGPDARVYANDQALPRAFLVDRERIVADGDAALAAVSAASFDPRRVAVTEAKIPGLQAGHDSAAASPGTAELDEEEGERVAVTVRARRPSLLVMPDSYAPGWRARIDGHESVVRRVDYLFRGVPVPRGLHKVELRYAPTSWRVGWIVSLAALLALVAVATLGHRRGSG